MVALYVTSSETGAGKTAICAGIGKYLLDKGKKVGYLRSAETDDAGRGDAEFMKTVLGLEEPVDTICLVIAEKSGSMEQITVACEKISGGKDVVIVEGSAGDSEVGEAIDARVIFVANYAQDLSQVINSCKDFGERLLGVAVNKVPGSQLERVQNELSAQFGEAGINLLGVLPDDRVLFSLTVSEIVEQIGGEILGGDDKSTELVENIMLGAMYVGYGPDYFGRKNNKAAVIRSERPDMQLAALETSTRCLVISGDAEPNAMVLRRAEDKKVPVVTTKEDIVKTVADIEEALGKGRFNQAKKLPRLAEIMGQRFDFQAIDKAFG